MLDSGHRNPCMPQLPPTTEEQIVDYSRAERRRLTVTQILITWPIPWAPSSASWADPKWALSIDEV